MVKEDFIAIPPIHKSLRTAGMKSLKTLKAAKSPIDVLKRRIISMAADYPSETILNLQNLSATGTITRL